MSDVKIGSYGTHFKTYRDTVPTISIEVSAHLVTVCFSIITLKTAEARSHFP